MAAVVQWEPRAEKRSGTSRRRSAKDFRPPSRSDVGHRGRTEQTLAHGASRTKRASP